MTDIKFIVEELRTKHKQQTYHYHKNVKYQIFVIVMM